jgi:hypothetical protein
MSQAHTSSQIGDLLVGAGLVASDSIDGALTMSRSRRSPLGKVLVDSGLVTESELNGTLQAQNLVRERLLDLDKAVEILRLMRVNGDSFVTNLFAIGCDIEPINFSRNLGKLFVDAGAISPYRLAQALETSILSGLPIARVLVLQKSVNEMVAYAGLTAQLLINERKIAYDQAVGALKLSHMHNEHIEEILEFGGLKRYREENSVRLGELLVLAELISELDLLSCVEKSMAEAKPLGQVLTDEGIISELIVSSALRAQKYIVEGTIDVVRAAEMLKECARDGRPLEFSVAELAAMKPVMVRPFNGIDNHLGLIDMIELIGIVTRSDLEQVRLVEAREPEEVNAFLLKRGFVDQVKLDAIKEGYQLIQQNVLSAEQLIFAFHVWLWRRGSFVETLSLLGWRS